MIAGADEDYPDWLWTLLDGGNQEKGLEKEVEGDLFCGFFPLGYIFMDFYFGPLRLGKK